MYQTRSEETRINQVYQRSERILLDDLGFHYRTRENELHGPFTTESRALFDLNIFLEVTKIERQLQEDFDLQLAWG